MTCAWQGCVQGRPWVLAFLMMPLMQGGPGSHTQRFQTQRLSVNLFGGLIAENGGYAHMMFVHRDPFSDVGYDDNISLSYKLPVRDE